MISIGIDPGFSGAMAIIWESGIAEVWDWPALEGIDNLRCDFNKPCRIPKHAIIEKQQPFPGQGISSTGKIMENYGIWQGILKALQIPYTIVTPQKWRKAIFDSMPRQADKKAMSLDLARRLYPGVELSLKRHEGRAEALLIARYGQVIANK